MIAMVLFAATTTLSVGAQAASNAEKTAEVKAPVAGVHADQKMKPSHVDVQTGVPQNVPEAKTDKPDPAKDKTKDKTKHFHPRDGKT